METQNDTLSHFPKDLINRLEIIYQSLDQAIKDRNIVLTKQHTITFYQILLDMFAFAGNNDDLIMDIGMLATGYFLGHSDDDAIDLGLGDLEQEIEDLFMHELDLPPHHTSYGSYDQPKQLVIDKLQQAIKILQTT